MKRYFIFLSLVLFTSITLAQFNVGANIQSQFVVKGIQLAKTPVIGGYLDYAFGKFNATTVITYSIDGSMSENLLILKFCPSIWSVSFTDYYYPYPANRFGNFAGKNAGSHYMELAGTMDYAGFTLLLSSNVYNDTTYSPYCQLLYTKRLGENSGDLAAFVGTTVGKTFFFNTTTTGVNPLYIGLKYSKDKYSLIYYINPSADVNGIVVAYEL
jgi:hypothetical protein